MRGLGDRLVPSTIPWARPRHEVVLLALVAVATLAVVYPAGAQDVSRMCVTASIARGHLSADDCLKSDLDRAAYGSHLYTDKAPGLSFLAVPVAQLVRLRSPNAWHSSGDLRLWAVRISTAGLALIVCAFLIGRIAEGLAPGWGGATLVTAATGTLLGSLAADNFGEVPATAFGFSVFVLAWSKRPAAAGLAAGLAVLVEYQTALIGLVVGAYALLGGIRAFGRYALGTVPGLLLLGLYDRAAFGSPFHVSYRYVGEQFASQQASGFFGIHSPSWHSLRVVLVGSRGLIVVAPVLVLAVAGLVLLWRSGRRAESLACGGVGLLFLIVESGYYDPYGGDSPGARFFIPGVPFLAVGIALAFARWRLLTSVCAAASVLASSAVLLTWPAQVNAALAYRHWTIWHALADFPANRRSSQLAMWTQKTVFNWAGVGRLGGGAIVVLAALSALAIGLTDGLGASRKRDVAAALTPETP